MLRVAGAHPRHARALVALAARRRGGVADRQAVAAVGKLRAEAVGLCRLRRALTVAADGAQTAGVVVRADGTFDTAAHRGRLARLADPVTVGEPDGTEVVERHRVVVPDVPVD